MGERPAEVGVPLQDIVPSTGVDSSCGVSHTECWISVPCRAPVRPRGLSRFYQCSHGWCNQHRRRIAHGSGGPSVTIQNKHHHHHHHWRLHSNCRACAHWTHGHRKVSVYIPVLSMTLKGFFVPRDKFWRATLSLSARYEKGEVTSVEEGHGVERAFSLEWSLACGATLPSIRCWLWWS